MSLPDEPPPVADPPEIPDTSAMPQKVQEMARRLEHLESVRRDFIANVSHELKTPLTAIRGMVDTILDDEEMDDATQRKFLARIQSQIVRLSTLVRDLIIISQFESNESGVELQPVDIRHITQAVVLDFEPQAARKELSIKCRLPEQPLVVEGDEEILRQVLINLIDNAVKYTPAGGKIQVSMGPDPEHGWIRVEDNGIGIPPELHDRVFERFYRVDKARSRQLGGTGLGLSIVKHSTLAMKGRIFLDSAPGKGSAFTIMLPLSK